MRRDIARDEHDAHGLAIGAADGCSRSVCPHLAPIQSPHARIHGGWTCQNLAVQHPPVGPLLCWKALTLLVVDLQSLRPFREWARGEGAFGLEPIQLMQGAVCAHETPLQIVDAHAVGLCLKNRLELARLLLNLPLELAARRNIPVDDDRPNDLPVCIPNGCCTAAERDLSPIPGSDGCVWRLL